MNPTNDIFERELREVENHIKSISSNTSSPYWFIALRPQICVPEFINSLENCKLIIQNITQNNYNRRVPDRNGANWVAQYININYPEYWRFYQSGQFISFLEILNSNPVIFQTKSQSQVVYPILKEFIIARKLSQLNQYSSRSINISIRLANVKDYILGVNNEPDVAGNFTSNKARENTFSNSWTIDNSESTTIFNGKALEAINWFATCFPWEGSNYPHNIFHIHYNEILSTIYNDIV